MKYAILSTLLVCSLMTWGQKKKIIRSSSHAWELLGNSAEAAPAQKELSLALEAVYPNPASDNTVLRLVSPTEEKAMIFVYAANGEDVWKKECLLKVGENRFPISLYGLSDGDYQIVIRVRKRWLTGRLRIER